MRVATINILRLSVSNVIEECLVPGEILHHTVILNYRRQKYNIKATIIENLLYFYKNTHLRFASARWAVRFLLSISNNL